MATSKNNNDAPLSSIEIVIEWRNLEKKIIIDKTSRYFMYCKQTEY